MNRRDFLQSCAGTAVMAAVSSCAVNPTPDQSHEGLQPVVSDLQQAAREAWLYGLMLIENSGARSRVMQRGAPNSLFHARRLMTVETQVVTATNNDTLYTRAWLDLSAGPIVIDIPETGSRYASFAMMDMYGTNFAILGTRTTGGKQQRVTLVGPMHAKDDPLAIRAPTPWVWLQIRILVENEADVPAVNAIQDAIRLTAPSVNRPIDRVGRDADWAPYFTDLQALLVENPPPASDLGVFDRIAPLGLGPAGGFDASRFSAAQAKEIAAGVESGRAHITGVRSGVSANGWLYPKPCLGDFKQDYLYRAEIAVEGLAALTLDEATYMRPITHEGNIYLPSDRDWMLRLEKDELPPVNGFWSLTAYERTPGAQFRLFPNPVARHAIRDRTPGLRYGADGSLEIMISRTRKGPDSNWLPAPTEGPLGLLVRCYLPRDELIDGRYKLPALRAL